MLGCEWACEGLWECWVESGHVRVCGSVGEEGVWGNNKYG